MTKIKSQPRQTKFLMESEVKQDCKINDFIRFKKGEKVTLIKLYHSFANPDKPEQYTIEKNIPKKNSKGVFYTAKIDVNNTDKIYWLVKFGQGKNLEGVFNKYWTLAPEQVVFFDLQQV